jgi:hypothetical protein
MSRRPDPPLDTTTMSVGSASAPMSLTQFVEPWHLRVRDVDDATMTSLLRSLAELNRTKYALTTVAAVVGASVFGVLPVPLGYALMMHVVLACMAAFPTHGIATLIVRGMFLREAKKSGLSGSAAMLLLVRAERRARTLRMWNSLDTSVVAMRDAVRDMDRA